MWVVLGRFSRLGQSWPALRGYFGGLGLLLGPLLAVLGPLLAVLGRLGPKSDPNLNRKVIRQEAGRSLSEPLSAVLGRFGGFRGSGLGLLLGLV